MFFRTALVTALSAFALSASAAPAEAGTFDVWAPPITSPSASTVWTIGSTVNVTWDATSPPSQVTNPTGYVILAKDSLLDVDNPLASGFPLSAGWVSVVVPSVAPGDDYSIVLFGDSGNESPVFSIVA